MEWWETVLARIAEIELLLPDNLPQLQIPAPADPSRSAWLREAEANSRAYVTHWLVRAIAGKKSSVTPLEAWLIRQRLRSGERAVIRSFRFGDDPQPGMDTNAVLHWALLEHWHTQGAAAWAKGLDQQSFAG